MRRISNLCTPNKCEYEFDALEVQMVTGAGSSGGPLVNRTGQLIGVLHGGTDTHSYFVACHHVREFLEPLVA
jgi:V8-like Glu-specific endopeptidase